MPKKRQHGDGGLYRIRNGTMWRGVVDLGFDDDGKRVQKYVHAKTQRACKDKLDELKKEIDEHGAPLDKQVTVATWSAKWLETVARPNVDPSTFRGYSSMCKKWIVPTLGRKKVSALKPSDVRELRQVMTDAGRSVSMLRQGHIVLSLMLDAAKAEGLCRDNVAKDVKKPSATKGKAVAKRGAFTTAEAIRILQAAADLGDSEGSRWWFKLLSGQRQGEILGATIADLDLSPDVETYTVSWKLEDLRREHGCGDQPCGKQRGAYCPQARWIVPDGFEKVHLTGAWHLTRPKSKTGRVVPLIPQLAEVMRRHLAASKGSPNPHGLVWRKADGSPILPVEDNQAWRDLLVSAGIIAPDQAAPSGTEKTGHWARHTTVTILASLGVDMQLIGEIVGHSSTEVTEIYRHAAAEEKRAAMALVGDAWAGAFAPRPAVGSTPTP